METFMCASSTYAVYLMMYFGVTAVHESGMGKVGEGGVGQSAWAPFLTDVIFYLLQMKILKISLPVMIVMPINSGN